MIRQPIFIFYYNHDSRKRTINKKTTEFYETLYGLILDELDDIYKHSFTFFYKIA